MKKQFAAIAAIIFAGSVHAASDAVVYHGFERGNPDLSTDWSSVSDPMALSSGDYDAIVYNGFEQGNPELNFGVESVTAPVAVQPGIGDVSGFVVQGSPTKLSSIYNGFERGNPDL